MANASDKVGAPNVGRANEPFGGLAMTAITPHPAAQATRRGKLTLAVLCAVAFLDFVDASIINVALPHDPRVRWVSRSQTLQWVPSGIPAHLRRPHAARRPARRSVWAPADPARRGPCSSRPDRCRRARRRAPACSSAPGSSRALGAALMLPAALSILTTTFTGQGPSRALGVWGAVAGLASAAGVLLGGCSSKGPDGAG